MSYIEWSPGSGAHTYTAIYKDHNLLLAYEGGYEYAAYCNDVYVLSDDDKDYLKDYLEDHVDKLIKAQNES